MQEIANVNKFKKELEELVNRYGWDNALDMPDYILAALIYSNLDNFKKAHEADIARREGRVL